MSNTRIVYTGVVPGNGAIDLLKNWLVLEERTTRNSPKLSCGSARSRRLEAHTMVHFPLIHRARRYFGENEY